MSGDGDRPDDPTADDAVHRPRTVDPGAAGTGPLVAPRTIGALGPVQPLPPVEQPTVPPLESFADPSWQPVTGQVPALAEIGSALAGIDDEIWTPTGEVAVVPRPGPDGSGPPRGAVIGAPTAAEVTGATPAATGPADEPEPEPGPSDAEPATEPAAEPAAATVAGPGLLRANLIVASGTLASRLTGLIRTSLIIFTLGKGLNDAYINANNTPNMIYELILGGILTAALVPLFTDDMERGDGRDGTSAIISFALVALLGVALLGMIAGPLIILLLSTGSAAASRSDYLAAGIPLAILFAPQIFFYGLMAVWSAVLNARHRFLAAAWAPVLNNLIAIATLVAASTMVADKPNLFDARQDPTILWVLGLGTTLGIVVMALSLYPAVRRAGVRLDFKVRPRHPAVRRAIRLSGWTFGYVVANQIAVIVIQILAKPSSGDPTRYQTAFQWFQLPHALLAVSIMVTFEPLLGRADARGDRRLFNDQLLLGFRLIGLLIIPAAAGYVALPAGLDARTFEATGQLATVFGLTGVIAGFAVGLPGFSTYLYALRGFYAMKNTKVPFVVNCIENAINIALAVAFVHWWGVVGLALAFGTAYNVSAIVAVVVLVRHSPGFDWVGLVASWVRLLLAATIMAGFVYGVVALIAPSSPGMLVPALGAGLAVGAVTYFAAIWALRVEGIAEVLGRLPVLRRWA